MQTCMYGQLLACPLSLDSENIRPEDCPYKNYSYTYVLTKRMISKVPTTNSQPSFLFCVSQESYICTYMAWMAPQYHLQNIIRYPLFRNTREGKCWHQHMFLVVQSRRRLRKNIQWGERHSLSFTLFKNIKNIFSSNDTCVQSERQDRYQQKCVPYSPCKKTSKAPYCSNVNKMRSWRVRKEKPCCIQPDPDYYVIAFKLTFCYGELSKNQQYYPSFQIPTTTTFGQTRPITNSLMN